MMYSPKRMPVFSLPDTRPRLVDCHTSNVYYYHATRRPACWAVGTLFSSEIKFVSRTRGPREAMSRGAVAPHGLGEQAREPPRPCSGPRGWWCIAKCASKWLGSCGPGPGRGTGMACHGMPSSSLESSFEQEEEDRCHVDKLQSII